MNSNKNIMYISNTSPLYYTVDLVSVVSVLVLTTMLVTNQPACLNLVTPPPPYTKTRPLIPQLCAPSRKQQSAAVWSLISLTDICIYISFLEAFVIATTSGSHLEKEITKVKICFTYYCLNFPVFVPLQLKFWASFLGMYCIFRPPRKFKEGNQVQK